MLEALKHPQPALPAGLEDVRVHGRGGRAAEQPQCRLDLAPEDLQDFRHAGRPAGGQAMVGIRRWVGINLALGVLVVVITLVF